MTDYGNFHGPRLVGAIKKALAFWHEKLALQHWRIGNIYVSQEGPSDAPFGTTHAMGYQTASIAYAPVEWPVWATVPDTWLARSLAHESAHLILFPLMDALNARLDGPWWEEITTRDEPIADHIATVAWRLLTPKDRAYVTGLFAAARVKPPGKRPAPK